jgi:ABC-type multidrug transport system fused ATPase/permease subunit
MSKSPLRKDKTCLNCRHVVENRFCPNCGQENTETRKTFHHLFFHFIEDLTHYENAFWRTIINLLFRPASLTKEYLSGKRLSYLAPVRLYIFISFITFFLISVFPSNEIGLFSDDSNNSKEKIDFHKEKKTSEIIPSEYVPKNIMDSIQKGMNQAKEKKEGAADSFNFEIKSIKELDSIQKFGKEKDKFNSFEYWLLKRGITVTENNTKEEIIEKGKESFLHNFPKVLLLYMPLFAFFLWLFHGKKRWYYFDHGIFTLHYFSFLLLINLILFIIHKTSSLLGDYILINFVTGIIDTAGIVWMLYYFFPAHHRFYRETRIISFLKGAFLLFLNCFFITILLLLFLLYTLINIH